MQTVYTDGAEKSIKSKSKKKCVSVSKRKRSARVLMSLYNYMGLRVQHTKSRIFHFRSPLTLFNAH